MTNGIQNSPFASMQWFQGVIENTVDPEGANRFQVRAIGYHSEMFSDVPTEHLPWASYAASAFDGPNVNPGEWCWGFFLDGSEAQQPIVCGILPGKPTSKDSSKGFNDPSGVYPRRLNEPTTSRLARGNKSDTPVAYSQSSIVTGVATASGDSWSEPASAYAAVYPRNHVIQTDGNNTIELDDTPGAERVHIFHKAGSFIEWHPNGDVVYRNLKDKYDVTFGDAYIFVNGNVQMSAVGDIGLAAGGDVMISAKGDISMVAGGDMSLQSKGSAAINASGSMSIGSSGSMDVGGSSVAIHGSGSVSIDGSTLGLNDSGPSAGSGASGSPVDITKVSRSAWSP